MRRFVPSRRRALRFFLIVAAVWAVISVGLALAVLVYGRVDERQPSDVIVVLGAGLRRDDQPNLALIRRSEQGAALYHAGFAPFVICSGGFAPGRSRSEADACRQILEANGVPRDAIILEERSRSTEENAIYSREIMHEHGWQTALLVSDGYHMLRAQWIFRDYGIDIVPSPTPLRPRLSTLVTAVAREVAALQWQAVKNLLQLPFTHVPVL